MSSCSRAFGDARPLVCLSVGSRVKKLMCVVSSTEEDDEIWD